jgi:hypothetical protein
MGIASILTVLLRRLVHDWYYVELLHGPCSHTSNSTPSTGSRLVLRGVYCMGLAPILPLVIRLLVHDRYYVEFAAWACLPYFQYYSV